MGTTKKVAEQQKFPGLKRILVAVDGSENSQRALAFAAQLARGSKSQLIILNVIDARAYDRDSNDAKKRALALVKEQAAFAKKSFRIHSKRQVIRPGDSVPLQIINATIPRKVDLIVVGSRGLGGFRKLLVGSTSNALVSHAPCSVLVVR